MEFTGIDLNILYLLDLSGTFAFAVSGTISAIDKKFDLFGAIFIGFVTAVGGGSVRDCFIGNLPVAWLLDNNYFYVIIAAVIFTVVFQKTVYKLRSTLFLFDTIGIGVFTVIGIEKGLTMNIPASMAVIMGVSTAVVGGVLRDVLCNEIPLIFHREVYATACILGGAVFILLQSMGAPGELTIFLTIFIIISVRILSVRFNWSLPRVRREN